MSGAICGIFHMDGRKIPAEISSIMMNKLNIYNLDVSKTWFGEQVFFGCGMHFITPESQHEELPFFEPSSGLSITADAIIDNRNELFNLLNIALADRRDIPDSQLILMAYKKWGEESPRYLAGDFAYAIWDSKKRELFCARDHVGKRTFYYSQSDNTFIFSTLMNPVLAISENSKTLNEEWIADYLALGGVLHEIDCSQTIYKNLMQLPPAHRITVGIHGIKMVQYWHALDTPELRLKSDCEYEEAFRDIFFEAVNCRLRSAGQVGVMLSGGLDSGSVASVAARELDKRGERLKAFSAIPMAGYKDWLPKRYIADESRYIELYKKYFSNIDITYCKSEGKSSVTNVNKFLEILEQPYKVVENLFWVNTILESASQSGCRVLLDGQFGNFTISYGDFLTHIFTLYKKMRWMSVVKEIYCYSKLHNLNSFEVAKAVSGSVVKSDISNALHKVKKSEDLDDAAPVNPDLAYRCKTEERLFKAGFGVNSQGMHDLTEQRRFITNNIFFSQLGPLDTKMSLAKGLLKRDPTRDKRVIEFCMSLPGDQYVRNGQERYLVRRTMTGILPDSIRTNVTVRGRQSADWLQRFSPMWADIKRSLEEMLQNKMVEAYLDTAKLKNVLNKIGDTIDNGTCETEIRTLFISFVFYKFIKNIENEA